MKIILSHDVDHLYWNQHYFRDLSAQKHLYRHSKALLQRQIDFTTWKHRISIFGRMHRLPELMNFYQEKGLKAHFFFGMGQALGLSYKPKEAEPWIKKVLQEGHFAGVHGIAYAKQNEIKKEYQSFQTISGLNNFGIRTHYLRMNGYTLERFNEQEYSFDTSIQGIFHPFKIGNLWEIPMSLMDASLVPNAQSNTDLKQWKQATKKRLDCALKNKIPYFVINLHDPYFDEKQFPTAYQWYHWLIDEILSKQWEVIDFQQAVDELNTQ